MRQCIPIKDETYHDETNYFFSIGSKREICHKMLYNIFKGKKGMRVEELKTYSKITIKKKDIINKLNDNDYSPKR